MHARHAMIIESACAWLKDVNSSQCIPTARTSLWKRGGALRYTKKGGTAANRARPSDIMAACDRGARGRSRGSMRPPRSANSREKNSTCADELSKA